MFRILVMCMLTALVAVAQGCPDSVKDDKKVRVRPKVNLPATPTLEIPKIEVLAENGAYTVEGVFVPGQVGFGDPVRVYGHVMDRHTCEGVDLENELCEPAHLLLVDRMDSPRRQLLVVGTDEQIGAMEVGGAEIVSGRFSQWTDDKWFIRSEGLLQMPAPEPEEE